MVNAVEITNPTLPDSITTPISVGQQTLSFEVNTVSFTSDEIRAKLGGVNSFLV